MGFSQPALRALPLIAFAGLAQGAVHGRHQLRKPGFQHIIRRAALEGLDGPLFAQGAGDEDEGHIGQRFPGKLQRRQPVKGRQMVVRQDQVGRIILEPQLEFIPGFDPFHRVGETAQAHGVLHQLGVGDVILQQ